METLRVKPQRIDYETLRHRLDCSFYHPDAIQLDTQLRQYGESKTLSELADPKRQITNGVRGPELENSEYYLVRLQNCNNWEVDYSDCLTISEKQFKENKRCQLYEGDIVVAIGGYVGNAAVVRCSQPAVIGQHSAVLPSNPKTIDGRYLLAYLNSKWGAIQFQRHVSGTVQPGVNLEDIRDIPIPIPPSKVQKYIGEKVRQAERLRGRSKCCHISIREILGDFALPNPPKDRTQRVEPDEIIDSLNPNAYMPRFMKAEKVVRSYRHQSIKSLSKGSNAKLWGDFWRKKK
ncbi:MAG: restriction endonuclease subunit S [Oculatellaceae cyanobacterium Prado106]|jgi:type I restriction enzyme S subunit|nr:restriction endonuclease subunit S [Oculatellaceae cyanobacterium Prado106]